jgi:hypothetical protein
VSVWMNDDEIMDGVIGRKKEEKGDEVYSEAIAEQFAKR